MNAISISDQAAKSLATQMRHSSGERPFEVLVRPNCRGDVRKVDGSASPESKTTLSAMSLRALSLIEHTQTETMLDGYAHCYHSYEEENRGFPGNAFPDT